MPANIVIPASPQEAEARLAELGPLATAIELERAAIVYALCKPGRSGRPTKSASFGRLSFSRFAEKGYHGLRSHTTVSAYWHTWQGLVDEGMVPEVTLGDEVELPDIEWERAYVGHPSVETMKASVAAALANDPRGVADAAYAVLKEGRAIEAERNADIVKQAHEEDVQDLMEQFNWTREQAEEHRLAEKHPLIEEANRKAKRAEIGTFRRRAGKVAESFGIVSDAVNAGDTELLGAKERADLQEASEVLQKVANDVTTLLWGGLEKLLDSGEEDMPDSGEDDEAG
jgi:hypothetical protein